MGNESSISGAKHSTAGDMYFPYVGTRTNDEKVITQLRAASQLIRPTRHNRIYRMAFTAIWSVEVPDGDKPCSRTGQFTAVCEDMNLTLTGFGITEEGDYLGDIWALDNNTLQWRPLQLVGEQISPRSHLSATVAGTTLYLFGGYCNSTYFNSLYAIDLTNGVCQEIGGTGNLPSPRREAIFENYNGKLFVWGGFDGLWPSALHVFDLESGVWSAIEQGETSGRTGVSYQKVGDKIFGFGGSKTGGLLQIDMENLTVSILQTTGSEPPSSLANSSMILVDRYLVLIGGKAPTNWTLIYACDLSKMWWFVLHVLPDGVTVSEVDGHVSDLGMFMLPRPNSMGAAYLPGRRSIVAFLGTPKKDPAPLFILSLGEALGALNLRTDMLEILHKARSG